MKDLTGQKFGRLTVIKYVGCGKWLCKCICGNEKIIRGDKLKSGNTKSCGCITKTKNGESKTRLCRIYKAMISRCYNPNNNRYKYYGLKGIKVCKEWLEDYQSFKSWANANGYNKNLTIDRIDCDGNYQPSNCRWITYLEQNKNRKVTLKYLYNNQYYTLMEWSKILNINYKKLHQRLKKLKWSVERAFNTP